MPILSITIEIKHSPTLLCRFCIVMDIDDSVVAWLKLFYQNDESLFLLQYVKNT